MNTKENGSYHMTGDSIEATIENPLGPEDGYYLVGFRTQPTLAKSFQLTGPCGSKRERM